MRIFSIVLNLTVILSLAMSGIVLAGHHKDGEGSGKSDRFAKYDTNGDGTISRDEFIALAEKRFKKMDADGDGVLRPSELKRRGKKHRQND